jgi:elongation factor 3
MPTENQQSIKVLDELFQKLTVSKESADIKESSNELASFINGRIGDQVVPDK